MRNKSLNLIWGNDLKELGYSKKSVNHFEKKYKKHKLCIDYDLMGYILMFRILGFDAFNKTKCIKYKDIKNMDSLTQIEFINLVNKIENEFKLFIENEE
ncbi:hypothetical protein [Winogradskyella damuponensis]|uniref:XRE family transcriptional regulator n=1 Tax=Winogradskyella damuponensis TaxID=943939 RepID=A0ABP8D1W1_9FLAO